MIARGVESTMSSIINNIRKELKLNSDRKTRESGMKFFKEKVRLHGVKTAVARKIAKKYFSDIRNHSKKEIFTLCEELWRSGFMEESFIACEWSFLLRKEYCPEDFRVFEKWVNKYVSNWASCDNFCNHTVGAFIEMYPEYIEHVKKWALSKNRWVRRASAVSLIVPARKGSFLRDAIDIAEALLLDSDDLVQKGYGWLLKTAGQAHQKEIYDFLMRKKGVMPRTALRYAIEKMPQKLKINLMEKKHE